MQKKEISLFSVGNFFLTVPKSLVRGIIQRFQKYSGIEKFYAYEGVITIFC